MTKLSETIKRLRELEKHPNYGPCDGFDGGECMECKNVIFNLLVINEKMRRVLKELVEDTECRWDHNKNCQEHASFGYNGTCHVKWARQVLEEIEK